MYSLHTVGVRVNQNCSIPALNSFRLVGLYVDLKNCFNEPHTFSIGFRSGDSAGVFHHIILFHSKKLVYIYYSVLGRCPAVTDGPLGNTCVKKVLRMPLESLRIWGHS